MLVTLLGKSRADGHVIRSNITLGMGRDGFLPGRDETRNTKNSRIPIEKKSRQTRCTLRPKREKLDTVYTHRDKTIFSKSQKFETRRDETRFSSRNFREKFETWLKLAIIWAYVSILKVANAKFGPYRGSQMILRQKNP